MLSHVAACHSFAIKPFRIAPRKYMNPIRWHRCPPNYGRRHERLVDLQHLLHGKLGRFLANLMVGISFVRHSMSAVFCGRSVVGSLSLLSNMSRLWFLGIVHMRCCFFSRDDSSRNAESANTLSRVQLKRLRSGFRSEFTGRNLDGSMISSGVCLFRFENIQNIKCYTN